MKYLVTAAIAALLVSGCASKNFVQEQVSGAESRQAAKVAEVSAKADANAAEIQKLQTLQIELSKKTDLALNKVSGFENYKILWEGEVSFGFDKYELDPVAQQVLGEAGEKMNTEPRAIIEISGFTDQVGSRDYNYILGQRRADAAKRYLFEKYGIGLFRTFTVSWGKDHATAGSTDNKRTGAKNRRVALKVWGPVTNTADVTPATN
jgi:outer membrane protein OmpA-like peptidoglycan-associated protein